MLKPSRGRLCLFLILLAFPAYARAGETSMRPLLGAWYRPGAWLFLEIETTVPPDRAGRLRPELHLGDGDSSSFVCRLPAGDLGAGRHRFLFRMIAGVATPVLEFRLVDAADGRVVVRHTEREILQPLAADSHLIAGEDVKAVPAGDRFVQMQNGWPTDPDAYESCSMIALGSWKHKARELSSDERRAMAAWLIRGGKVLCLPGYDPEALLRECETAMGGGLQSRQLRIEGAKNPPTQWHIGFGRLVALAASEGNPAWLGQAIWKRLTSRFQPAAAADLRLAPTRYSALGTGWPEPPRPKRIALLQWLAVWVLILATVLSFRSVRRSPRRLAIVSALLCVALAALFLRAAPARDARIVRATIRSVAATGNPGASLLERLTFVTPFGETCVIPFADRPPRVFSANADELRGLCTEIERFADGSGCIRLMNRGDASVVRYGLPLLLSRTEIGSPQRRLDLFVQPVAGGVAVSGPQRLKVALHRAELATARGIVPLSTYRGEEVSRTYVRQPDETATGRDRVAALYVADNPPGAFATLAGWTTPDAGESDLGIFETHDLFMLPESE